MKHIYKLLIIGVLLCANSQLFAQLNGDYYRANDGHIYFKATNTLNTSGTIKITAISYYNDEMREEYVTIRGYGDGFYLGPTTPWKWYWHKGDRLYITYPDGSSVFWECPYTEPHNEISFHNHGDATPPNHSRDGYIYQGRSVKYNGNFYKLYKKSSNYYIYDRKDGWIKIQL